MGYLPVSMRTALYVILSILFNYFQEGKFRVGQVKKAMAKGMDKREVLTLVLANQKFALVRINVGV